MATNKRYYWIKLKEEFFTDKRIKRLRRISGGDTYTIIYLKLLLLSLKDEGKLYYNGVESDFIKELALTIDETDDMETDISIPIKILLSCFVEKSYIIQEAQIIKEQDITKKMSFMIIIYVQPIRSIEMNSLHTI